jgi:hypothetical protein
MSVPVFDRKPVVCYNVAPFCQEVPEMLAHAAGLGRIEVNEIGIALTT